MQTTEEERFTGEVDSLAFGGNGIVRKDGLVIFIPFAVIGDLIEYQIISKKKKFAIGKLITVFRPSPFRTTPPCPYFGACGGCQLQHITYQMQLTHKTQCVLDALKRIGKLKINSIPPIIPAVHQWAYRRHVTLSLRPNDGFFNAGYITADNTSLLKVVTCPIFIEEKETIIKEVQTIVRQLKSTSDNTGRVTILKHLPEKYILYFQFDKLPENCFELLGKALPYLDWVGIIVNSPQKSFSLGITKTTWIIDAFTFKISPLAFSQNHPEQSANIYRLIGEIARKSKPKTVLDLYCGIGVSSIFLAHEGPKVVGIESNPTAIELAQKNAKDNNLETISFECVEVEKVLKDLLKQNDPELVLVNPPRNGLDESVVQALLEYGPNEILYISCMPTTLARDLSMLCEEKYAIELCQAFDMFPQTMHVETLVHLKRV
jgi:23S rRNA (uracil1939-C5)-methyltransferase